MRVFSILAFSLIASGCSEYDLTAPPQEEPGVTNPETPPVVGDSSSPLDAPVAVCSSNPDTVRPPFESNSFIGRDSYDPENSTIADYQWRLKDGPTGSGATLGGSGADRTFTADQAGLYVAELIVVTADGRVSEPCEVELNAIPAEALWIEMFWEHSGDDMDLHLLRPGGALETTGDCYFMNCDGLTSLEWGAAGGADNPALDLDDISGTGPENINIGAPEFGTFTVVVHDYPGSSYTAANSVTVNIYIDGMLEFTNTRAISGEDSYNYIAEVDWPTAQIRGL
ncbi:MAG: hypothetical protein KC912_14905 [Proteobacteria bacterium]|nr:hypothetical protein [Pseudomonadota bacterium]